MTLAIYSSHVLLLAALGACAAGCAAIDPHDSATDVDTRQLMQSEDPGSGSGAPAPSPEVCTYEHRPVCGCDHRTYANACVARMAGATVLRHHACTERDCSAAGGTVVTGPRGDDTLACPDDRTEHGIVHTGSSDASIEAICCVPR